MGAIIKTMLALLGALTITSCAAVRSTPLEVTSSAVGSGLHYSMPMGLLRIQLITRGDEVYLDVSEPFIIGDPNATYLLDSSSGLFANQEYRFVVDPQSRLLTYVNSSSEGQAGQILQRLVQSAAYAGGAPPLRGVNDDQRLIYSRIINPFREPGCNFGETCVFDVIGRELAAAAGKRPEDISLTLTPLFTVAAPSTVRRSSRGDHRACRRSICYRAPLPYTLSVRVGSTDLSQNISLPNEAPVLSASVPAGLFATSRARVELYQGMPARYVVDRDNELLAIAIVPFNVVNAGFTAISNVIQLRVNYRNALETERQGATPPTPATPPSETAYNYGDGAPTETGTREPGSTAAAPWSDQFDSVTVGGSATPASVLFSIPLSGDGALISAPAASEPQEE